MKPRTGFTIEPTGTVPVRVIVYCQLEATVLYSCFRITGSACAHICVLSLCVRFVGSAMATSAKGGASYISGQSTGGGGAKLRGGAM